MKNKFFLPILSLPLLLSGCVSFESYIFVEGDGKISTVDASIGSPFLGWESYLVDEDEEFYVLDEEGFRTGETVSKKGEPFDYFVKESSIFFDNEVLNKSTLFNESLCSAGVNADIFIYYCLDESLQNENIFNGSIIEGDWSTKTIEKQIYGQTVQIQAYEIEGRLSGIAKEIFDTYRKAVNNGFPDSDSFIEKLESPHIHDGQEEHSHDYIKEPVGFMTIILNSGEIIAAEGSSVKGYGEDYVTLDLNSQDVNDSIYLTIVLENPQNEPLTSGKEELNSNPDNAITIIIAIASLSGILALSIMLVLRFRRLKSV